ncbi:MAG: hypothetical protein OXP66_03980 [Candidatus Tectomicrobia bacterium]|nr:hypothetical protein [Candidatus Tectomicrobia bacterium]
MDCLAWQEVWNQPFQFGYQLRQIFKRLGAASQDCNAYVELPKHLLHRKIVVHCDQNVEVFLSRTAHRRFSVPSNHGIQPFRLGPHGNRA